MCIKALEVGTWKLKYVPDHFKTQKMCDDAVWGGFFSLQYVPDYFVTQQLIELWDDDNDYCNDDEIIKWYDDYEKRKAQKAKIKEELLLIAWHPDRVMDWCMSQEKKRQWK